MVISTLESSLSYLNSSIHSLKEYYFFFNYRLFFVFGLVFGRALTNYAIVNVLSWYFTYHEEDLVVSSILSNVHDSLASVLVIFMANATDSYVGRFYTLLFSNTAYIGGLMLLLMFNPYDVKWLVLIMLVLLALGTSGDQVLQQVLEDLVNDFDKSQDQNKKRSIERAAIWSRIAKVAAAICTLLWVAPGDAVAGVHSSWGSSFLICIVTMTVCLIIFCIGHNSYHQGQLIERPIDVFFRVITLYMPIKKLLRYLLFNKKKKTLLKHMSRHITNFSRLEGKKPLSLNTKGQEVSGHCSSKQDDKVIVKRLLRMFPMWAMFLVVYLISATGSTFFLQQFSNLNINSDIVVQLYDLIKVLLRFAIPIMYSWILCGLSKYEKVKIGVGMLCGIGSCVFAWQLEVQRLKRVNNLGDKDANTSISFLWLVPQFCMLGGMEGLTGEGLLEFYKSQVKDETLQSYGEEYIELVTGVGMFVNIMLMLFVKNQVGWFGDTINDSRLDKYYLLLIFVFLANFIIYCFLARFYYKDDQFSANDDQELDHPRLPNDDQELDNQLLANDDQKQDNQLLVNDDQKQNIQLLPNDDQKQDNQLLPNDDQKQDNQLLANDDQKQDNQLS